MYREGDVLGEYRLAGEIGAGSASTVYRSVDPAGRPVAVKVYRAPDSGWSERALRSLRELDHPNIIRIHEWFVDAEGRLCLVQELADESLDDVLERSGSLRSPQDRQLAVELLRALEHAHDRGVLHRDLKPANVLVVDGTFKLADFDSGGVLDPGTGTTQLGEISGTPRWMSPEQLSGSPQSPASDLFGLGLVLLEAFHGSVPGTEPSSYVSLLRQRVSEPIVVPEGPYRPLIVPCLAIDPSDRWSSAHAALQWLEPVAQAQATFPASVSPPAPTAPVQPSATIGAPPRPAGSAQSTPTSAVSPRRSMIGLALLGVVAVAVAVVSLLTIGSAGSGTSSAIGPILLGLVIAAVGVLVAIQIRRRIPDEDPEINRRAASIVFGVEDKGDLTSSLYAEAASVVAKLETPDAGFLGLTIHAMIGEFRTSETSGDRQQALLNALALMEKVQHRLSPWYVRHRDSLALGVSVVGGLTGLFSAVVASIG